MHAILHSNLIAGGNPVNSSILPHDRRSITDIYSIPFNKKYIVYAPLKRIAFITSGRVVNYLGQLIIANPDELCPDDRIGLSLLTSRSATEPGCPLQTPQWNVKFLPTDVTLFLTTVCNLRCIYCYASSGGRQRQVMDLKMAKLGIDFVHQNALAKGKGSFSVGFHGGGEPCTNWSVLVESQIYAKKLADSSGLTLQTILATNGILSHEKCNWIISNINHVSLSLDGLPEVQDIQRPFPSGKPSSGIVFQTLKMLDAAKVSYAIRMTVTSHAVRKLPESVRYLLSHAHPVRFQIEPVYNLGRGRESSLHVSAQDFITSFREARSVAKEFGVELVYSGADIKRLSSRFCQSCGDGFNITPNGSVSGCFEVCDEQVDGADVFIFGHFDRRRKKFIFDENKLNQLRMREVGSIPWCQGCFSKWNCSGDCQYQSHMASSGGEFCGSIRCEINRALLLDQLLENINNSGGKLWTGDK